MSTTEYKAPKVTLLAVAASLAVSGAAIAETKDTTVDAYVGLTEAFGVTCSDVHIGVYRAEIGEVNSGSDKTVTVDGQVATDGTVTTNEPTISGDGIALSTASIHDAPAVGECNVSGAPGDNSSGKMYFDGTPTTGEFATKAGSIGADTYAFGTIDAPDGGGAIPTEGMDITLKFYTGSTSKTGDTNTSGTFTITDDDRTSATDDGNGFLIGGTVKIPDSLTANDLGGYVASGVNVTVDVTDSGET